MKRTRACEILDSKKIPYELKEFEATAFTAEEVAEKLSVPLDIVFKTLVARAGEPVMCVVPGTSELNLKKLAATLGEKRAELVKLDELPRLTGYLKGGCSPLGSKKEMPVLIDESAQLFDKICVSAGLRGLQLYISPEDLRAASGGRYVDLSA